MNITIIYPYYMNWQILNKHIESWNQYDSDSLQKINFIVVDDGSPFPLTSRSLVPFWKDLPRTVGKEAVELGFVNLEKCNANLTVYRINEDLGYNISGAKNLGALLATTDWIFLCDIDYVLPAECAKKIVNYDFISGNIYFPAWRKRNGKQATKHENNFVVEKWDFWKNGGYDEDFAGFYAYEENYFVSSILCKNLNRINTSDFWTVWYDDSILPGVEWPRSKKDFKRNLILYESKIKYNIPHSKRCLRFSWDIVYRNKV